MFAKVIIDIAHAEVDRLFTYRVPDSLDVQPGMHVRVPFGHSSAKQEAFIIELTPETDEAFTVKEISAVIEPYPILLPDQLALAFWMQRNYNCLLVDALRLMIPAELRGGRVSEKVARTFTFPAGADPDALLASLADSSGKCRAPRQAEVLSLLKNAAKPLTMADIQAYLPGSSASVAALKERGFLIETGTVTFRRPEAGLPGQDHAYPLTQAQKNAVERITAALGTGETFLLHGVTGSGKTEVYMHCIDVCLRMGKQAIVLVPEISLTPQTVGRFRQRFSEDVAVLHSRLSAGERYDEWRRIRLGKARLVVGARSAVFAPLTDIGLIIVDEEHEGSYQSETAPRYHAVEVAQKRAAMSKAPLVLGSATPSLLSYFRAESGRYTLLSLPERVCSRPMPEVEIVDMREEFLSGNNGIFSGRLIRRLSECLSAGMQAMLFLNRRGYSTFVSCRACGNVITCDNCDLSMTYHKGESLMKCHFCGAVKPVPTVCPVCGKPFVKYFGVGTEQVEEQLRLLFPDVSAIRMDTDAMRGKDAMQQMLSRFSRGDAQVLIGTQMIAKGHDFPNVTLVGVVAADATLCIPDYRSTERTFQLLTQVAGRAGRDQTPGRVVVQTYSPGHPAIRFAKEHDYAGFYRYEIAERRKTLFPPYSLFLRLLFSGRDEDALNVTAAAYGEKLEQAVRETLGAEGEKDLLLLVSSPAPIKKKQGVFRYQILMKLLRTKRTADVIRMVYGYVDKHRSELFAVIEVNPQDMF